MEDFIKPKLRKFAKKMGVASKSNAKPLDVTASKPQLVKLIESMFDQRDKAAIKSRIEKIANVFDDEN